MFTQSREERKVDSVVILSGSVIGGTLDLGPRQNFSVEFSIVHLEFGYFSLEF